MSTGQLQLSIDTALTRRDNPTVSEELRELELAAGVTPFLRASGLASCGRKQSYAAQGVARNPFSTETMIAMLQGDWGETGMARLLADAGYIVRDNQRELSYYDQKGREILRGHIDGILGMDTGLIETEWSLWEMKMMSAFRYKNLYNKGVEVSTPDYYDQVQIYMGLLRSEGEPIETTTFMAVAKDPSAVNMGLKKGQDRYPVLYIEEVPFDQEHFDHLLYRAEDIHSVIRQGGLYPRERTPGKDWDCSERFCPFWSVCDPINAQRRSA